MNMSNIPIFLVRFENEISFHEIPLFRGAILNALEGKADILYHNHMEDNKFRYSYPLIQYKRIHKKAAILCIGKGVEVIGEFLASQKYLMELGNRPIQLEIESINSKKFLIQVCDSVFRYRIRNWIALNSDNYIKYKEMDEISSRIAFLESILIGNLLSLAKGLGIDIDKEIMCKLLAINEPRIVYVKETKMMTFDAEFKTNLSIPDYAGVGKHVSLGFGTVVRVYNDNNEK